MFLNCFWAPESIEYSESVITTIYFTFDPALWNRSWQIRRQFEYNIWNNNEMFDLRVVSRRYKSPLDKRINWRIFYRLTRVLPNVILKFQIHFFVTLFQLQRWWEIDCFPFCSAYFLLKALKFEAKHSFRNEYRFACVCDITYIETTDNMQRNNR